MKIADRMLAQKRNDSLSLLAPLVLLALLVQSNAVHASIPSRSVGLAYEGTRVKIRVIEDASRVTVRGLDLGVFSNGANWVERADHRSRFDLQCREGKVHVEPDGQKAALPPRPGPLAMPAQKSLPKDHVSFESPSGFLAVDGRALRDRVHVVAVGNQCDVVNELDIERYLDGLVNSEFNAKWSEEAIAAQVVAARTYALYQMSEARKIAGRWYDLDSTEKDQVYEGAHQEDPRAGRMVARTRGLVLTASAASVAPLPIKAFYHSTCGGQTELPQAVWGRPLPGFKKTVSCPFCGSSPAYHWQAEVTSDELKRAILTQAGSTAVFWPSHWRSFVASATLTDLRSRRGENGRVTEVVSVWAGPTGQRLEIKIPSNRLRSWMGVQKVRSTAFEIFTWLSSQKVIGPTRVWRFEGRGNGHGVGLCQWGAKVMGEKGYPMAAILKRYYPDARLAKLW
jgi:stage II sporulation protein D